MPGAVTKQIKDFLKPYPKRVQQTALWLRQFMWEQYPDDVELIYDNYNFFVFGFCVANRASDAVCSVVVAKDHCAIAFMWGVLLDDPEKRLKGGGNQVRNIRVDDPKDFPVAYMKKLLRQAHEHARAKMKPGIPVSSGKTIIQSISSIKRRPDGSGKTVKIGKKTEKSSRRGVTKKKRR